MDTLIDVWYGFELFFPWIWLIVGAKFIRKLIASIPAGLSKQQRRKQEYTINYNRKLMLSDISRPIC